MHTRFEQFTAPMGNTEFERLKVFGGWIVVIERGGHPTATFVSDINHDWVVEDLNNGK